jgi:predicted nucleotidyltransferase
MTHTEQIESLKQQIVSQYAPDKIYLFGTCAKGIIRQNSDIDLCIVKDTPDIREFKRELQLNLESEIPVDYIVYTPENWLKHSEDSTSFAYLIKSKGVQLYG